MHKYLKTIVFIGGALAGIVALLGIQKLVSYESLSILLNDESASAVVRNYGLLALGLVGIVTAMIRLSMADTQQRQDKRSDLFDRFQKSSEMLNSENMAVRQAGLYTLAEIAKEQPNEFYIMVQSLFCGFLRNASTEQKQISGDWKMKLESHVARKPEWPDPRADMQDAIQLFSQLRNNISGSYSIELHADFVGDLSGLFLPGTRLTKVNLSSCLLKESVFCDTHLTLFDFGSSDLQSANLDRAIIAVCEFDACTLGKTNFRWTQFEHTKFNCNTYDWVDFKGAYAYSGEFKLQTYGLMSLKGLSKLGSAEPEFDDHAEQSRARSEAISEEEFESIADLIDQPDSA